MPCPELGIGDVFRLPRTREQYDIMRFRRHCRKIAEELANQAREYTRCGMKLEFVMGVERSPSCGVNETSGIFIEELRSALEKKKIETPFYGVDFNRLKETLTELAKSAKLEA